MHARARAPDTRAASSFRKAGTIVKILSVNRACARPVRIGERTVMTAIGKVPVTDEVAVGPLGLEGD